jgi:hypothetical protein
MSNRDYNWWKATVKKTSHEIVDGNSRTITNDVLDFDSEEIKALSDKFREGIEKIKGKPIYSPNGDCIETSYIIDTAAGELLEEHVVMYTRKQNEAA